MRKFQLTALLMLFCLVSTSLFAAKLAEVKVLDKDYVMLTFYDGEVTFVDDNQEVVNYNPALNIANAIATGNWKVKSSGDPNYGTSGRSPSNIYRKSKVNGMGQMEWLGNDYRYEYTMAHTLFIKLPFSMVQGKTYTIEINSNTNSDVTTRTFTYDIFNSRSEAVHVNVVGYLPSAGVKAADLYAWLGDGGGRDYSSFEGKKVYIYNVATNASQQVGTVTFWKASAGEAQGYNYTKSNVWNVDFTSFTTPGTYRLAVEGVGSSDDFVIGDDVFADPFKVSLLGYFYMRMGQTDDGSMNPPPRPDVYIPNVNPSNTKVYITTMTPYHPDWGKFNTSASDPWDTKDDWAPYVKPGSPQNPNAWGGYSDAFDKDRHLGHISNIYDLLLPYLLTNGGIPDDNTGIPESGNGIPDIIDAARWEVDFWLRLRDGKGYSHGLNNPNDNNVFYQAGATGVAAWANALNAAMLAEAFRIAGNTSLMNVYKDSATVAYNYASALADPMLDKTQEIGNSTVRGRDLKMMAAAFLFNLTGNTAYEDVINAESVVTNSTSEIVSPSTFNQLWGTAAYALTQRPVRYPTLRNNMRAAIIHQAKVKEANYSFSRPTRRATNNDQGYFQTIQFVQHTLVAHAITTDPAEKSLFADALLLEASWSLGRNPLNIIQMTTATTPLASERSVENLYGTGRDDGVDGLHPGFTPYWNTDDWFCGMVMGCPSNLTSKNYPNDIASWPKGELAYDVRWVWAHAEFTPQQTMRGKTALYGYIYAMGNDLGEGVPTSIAVTGVNVAPTSAYVTVGATKQLTATLTPANATNKKISWSSSNTSVATVSSIGLVTGVAPGTATITATSDDGAKTATSTITVTLTNANLALDKPATASSSETTATNAAKAVDGDESTRWSSLFTDPQWLSVDLGASYNISQVVVKWEPAYATAYEVQVSTDGSTWTPIKTVTGNTELLNDHTGLSATARYVRIYGTARATDYGYSIWELEVYGTSVTESTLRNPENPTSTVAGLEYKYYEGSWNNLPNFDALTAAETGNVTGFDLGIRNRDDNFGVKFTGYINVASDGEYTFYTSSDDGSKLYIGTTEVVNNDGLHGIRERSGTIGLKAGKHAITVTFFEKTGGQALTVSYAGPSLSKTTVPASALFRAGTTDTPIPSGSTIVISARGSCGTETMELRVNNTPVKTWTNVATTVADYTYTGFTGGNVKVAFTNESGPSNCDKNVYVDYIKIGTTTYQTETSATRTGSGDSEWLWSNGYFDFGTKSAAARLVNLSAVEDVSVKVYPTPTSIGKVTIELDQHVKGFSVELTTSSGVVIKRASFAGRSGELPVNELRDGLYLLQIQDGNTVHTRNLIIQQR